MANNTGFWRSLVTWMLLVLSLNAAAQTTVLINPGDFREQSRVTEYFAWKAVLESALRKAGASAVTVQLSSDATRDLQTTRSRILDVYVAPAHVVGSAVRYGYVPLVGLDLKVQTLLVAPQASGITTLEQAKGKRLGLPQQDSLVTYLFRGEINAANTTIKRHFGSVYETRYQESLLICLQLFRCDVVAVERLMYERWKDAGEKLVVLMESRAAPGLSVAVRTDSKLSVPALRNTLSETLASDPVLSKIGKPVAREVDNFAYVGTLGYFTPRSLPGAKVVDAAAVAQLLQRGARYIDARNDTEFNAGHVAGAKLVPYVEKSPKDTDYDAALDQFDLTQLGSDLNAELVFACNGPECWKSYKASRSAVKAGFTKVNWFRGGLPEWRSAGFKVEVSN